MLDIQIGTKVKSLVDVDLVSAGNIGTVCSIDQYNTIFMYQIHFPNSKYPDRNDWASEDLSHWDSGKETKNWIEIIGEKQ